MHSNDLQKHENTESIVETNNDNVDNHNEQGDLPLDRTSYIPRSEQEDLEAYDHNSTIAPGVEWIYPTNFTGQRSEYGDDNTSLRLEPSTTTPETPEEYVVDPSHSYLSIEVEGNVVPTRLCFIKICGMIFCSDTFRYYINPKVIFIMLVFIPAIAAGRLISAKINVDDVKQNQGGIAAPNEELRINISLAPSDSPCDLVEEERTVDITKVLFDLSGDLILNESSPQNRALNWILEKDKMNLTHTSSNLLQRYAMMVMFYSLNGDEWFRNYGYGSDANECNWFGVQCREDSTISALDLSVNNLQGHLPYEIGALSHLQRINLIDNLISGSIPSSLGNLHFLEILKLARNNFSGSLPDKILSSVYMTQLMLDFNKLRGSIPSSIQNLRNVEKIRLDHNEFTGMIPSEIGELTVIKTLNLSSNKLHGTIPASVGELLFLEHLILENNYLTGTIPSTFQNAHKMRIMRLNHNSLSGTIPSSLFLLPRIITLKLNDNNLTGNIPEKISPSMNGFSLSNNKLNGTIPNCFGNSSRLLYVSLHSTELTGIMPSNVCDLRLKLLTADCLGENPKVYCECCTECY